MISFIKDVSTISIGYFGNELSSALAKENNQFLNTGILISIIIICLLGVFLDKIILISKNLYNFIRQLKNYYSFKIGVLTIPNKYIFEEKNSWVNLSEEEILAEISKHAKYDKTLVNKILEYKIVLNPFGGNYPEQDIYKLTSFHQILEFVSKGGVFINISDIPFWRGIDFNLFNFPIDTTEFIYNEEVKGHPFFLSLVTKKLFVKIIADIPNTGKRYFILDKYSNFNINSEYEEIIINNNSIKLSDTIGLPYGKGYFIFSTDTISKDNISNISKLLKEAKKLSRLL